MKHVLLAAMGTLSLAGSASTQNKEVVPHPTTVTFYVSNVECDRCVVAITSSVKKVATVTGVDGLTAKSGFVNVSFDSHAASFHQVAQAIADAAPQHDKKYEPSIRIQVPEYGQGDNRAKVDAIFNKLEGKIKVEPADKEKGTFVVHFLPLKVDPAKKGPQGFNGGQLGHPIRDPAPKGLGLKFSIVREKLAAGK